MRFRCNTNQFMLLPFIGFVSCGMILDMLWPPEIIQQAIPNGPIRTTTKRNDVHMNERTCELAFHEANQVWLVTIV